jgi:glycosyltransferase involved in cell wall biosynthesis
MINHQRICVVLPAYNAAQTLKRTIDQIDRSIVDDIIVVDDGSTDETRGQVRQLGLSYAFHRENHGYGGNQKTCYALALAAGADITVMLHPDYQYEPLLLPALAHMVASGVYDVAIGSRILGKGALQGGMPLYKYASNRFLTFAQNVLIGQKLSEYHTGYRAFSRRVLETLPLAANSDDFVFDNQMLVQCHHWGFRIAEISCPTKYFPEASSINFRRSLRYGFGTLGVGLDYRAAHLGWRTPVYLNQDTADQHRLSLGLIAGRVSETNVHPLAPAQSDPGADGATGEGKA